MRKPGLFVKNDKISTTGENMSEPEKKLTRQQWEALDIQFSRTPGLADSFSASGEHYILISLFDLLHKSVGVGERLLRQSVLCAL